MAKKAEPSEFSVAKAIRECFAENPKLTAKDMLAAIETKYPKGDINRNSFSVGYYTIRKKLGIGGSRRRKKVAGRSVKPVNHTPINLDRLYQTANFINEVGGADVALEAIRAVQSTQIK